jgi:hypothetical protein
MPKKQTTPQRVESPANGNGAGRPGREPGVLMPGSIAAQIATLAPDDFLIFTDAPNRAQVLNTAIRRYRKIHDGGEFVVQLCIGNTIDLDSLPFRFYRLRRTA